MSALPDSKRARGAGHARSRGFTLVELMVVIVIVSTLLGIGVPLFETFIRDQRVRAATSDLRVGLTTARSEAVKRNRAVELLPEGGDWSDGWNIPSPEAGDPNLLTHLQPGELVINGPGGGVEFSPMGRVTGAQDFTVRIGPEADGHMSCLQVQQDGRIVSVECPEPEEE